MKRYWYNVYGKNGSVGDDWDGFEYWNSEKNSNKKGIKKDLKNWLKRKYKKFYIDLKGKKSDVD